ncbi:MAG: diaminopimelate decarboxylase [Actinobacteria bacterium]|nr:diaminopimelate decarboxylase [Actinomycetota bacterium]
MRSWRHNLAENFQSHSGNVYYAAKAFISVEIAKILASENVGLDVCTGGELAVARAANFPAERIEMHGNNKSESEIRAAIDYRVRTIVLDSLHEIERVARIAEEFGVVQRVLTRLTPGVEAHTHEAIATAHEDVKFGFSIASGAALEAARKVRAHPSLKFAGVHAHIGSQIFDTGPFELSTERLIEFLGKLKNELDLLADELVLGGGYGIAYVDGDDPIAPATMMKALSMVVDKECKRQGFSSPKISIEPGRAIIGPSMTTIYEVGTTKEVRLENGENRRYISVDGGMSDNIRPGLYGARYMAILANRNPETRNVKSRVVGKHCETGDIVISEIELPSDIAPGDLLAVPATGAYGRSMASNYNHVPRPPVISVVNGTARTILRRETESDLLALDVVEKARKIEGVGR